MQMFHRRSIRLKGYDYTQPGAYFITLATADRLCIFGDVMEGEMRLNDVGVMVDAQWRTLCDRFPNLVPDVYVIMPNHIHAIIQINGAQISAHTRCKADEGAMNRATTIGEIVRAFKAVTTRHLRKSGVDNFAWQRNYYEHIIRDEHSLVRIREYIINNPSQWALDHENPARTEFTD